jgi:hypothetical protein
MVERPEAYLLDLLDKFSTLIGCWAEALDCLDLEDTGFLAFRSSITSWRLEISNSSFSIC